MFLILIRCNLLLFAFKDNAVYVLVKNSFSPLGNAHALIHFILELHCFAFYIYIYSLPERDTCMSFEVEHISYFHMYIQFDPKLLTEKVTICP